MKVFRSQPNLDQMHTVWPTGHVAMGIMLKTTLKNHFEISSKRKLSHICGVGETCFLNMASMRCLLGMTKLVKRIRQIIYIVIVSK